MSTFSSAEAGFQEMVRELLAESGLPEKEQEKIVKASWTIAKCRMSELLKSSEGEESDFEFPLEADQSDLELATLIAERLTDLYSADEKSFKELTKSRTTTDEKAQIKEDAPKKPPKMDEFMNALKSANRYDAVDIALLGRMTTSEAFQDVEAAMQVAHAISTHAVVNEVDYWTAVDDLGKTGGGAGHVDEAMLNSACFYKYFCLDWKQLVDNLAGPEPQNPGKDADEKKQKAYEEAKGKYSKILQKAEKLAACTVGHFHPGYRPEYA